MRPVPLAGFAALGLLCGFLAGRLSRPDPLPAPVLVLSGPVSPLGDTLPLTGGRVQVGDVLQLDQERVQVVGLIPRVIRGYGQTPKAAHPRGTLVLTLSHVEAK